MSLIFKDIITGAKKAIKSKVNLKAQINVSAFLRRLTQDQFNHQHFYFYFYVQHANDQFKVLL